ncbi:MAG TPA: hypothetical protein VG733_11660, partial [Chthoniobacteraceae bacterium]|nr:hypothetical protein [Chthoniobacteraceae bacterium]
MNWFALLILVPLALIGLSGPFATTILGCIAISQIRRSNGKIHGLGLAVFDALFYPLLALAGIILLLVRLAPPSFMYGRIVVLPLAAAVFAWLATVIVRRVWRAASRGIDGAPGAEDSRPRSDARRVITLLAVVILPMIFVIGIALLSWRFSRSAPRDAYSLADHPEELRERSISEVIQAGIAKPLAPWAWQELDRRHLTPADGDRILS